MADEGTCVICEASFRASAMVGEKCALCAELYPKARTKEEVKIKTKNKAETLTEGRVKDIVYEILEEANISRHECEKCGKQYFRTSPAQKVCKNCKAKEVVKTKESK